MIELFVPLLLLLGLSALWHAALGAREIARAHADRLCRSARLQLLDQTVSLHRVRLRHLPQSGWQVQRIYGFEVSSDGNDRLPGSLRMSGNRLQAWTLPGEHGADRLT